MSDLISRQDVINMIKESHYDLSDSEEDMWAMVADAEALPSADRPTGKWVFDDNGYFHCEFCGKKPNDQNETTDYCPNCGSEMVVMMNDKGRSNTSAE